MKLFDRIAQVTIGRNKPTATEQKFFLPLPDAFIVEKLRVRFSIDKNLAGTPNTCDVTISNLAPATRAEVERDGVIVRIDAGHDGVARRLFVGDVTYARSTMVGSDWETFIQIGDGARAYEHARTNHSFKAGTQVIAVLKEAAKSVGLELPREILASAELKEQFAAGWHFSGLAKDELTRLLAPFGYGWSIQDGRLQIIRDEETVKRSSSKDELADTLSEATGMIGSPTFGKPDKKNGKPPLTVKMLLYPELTPGGKVSVESREVNGVFKVKKVKHTGDTHGDDWCSETELVKL